MKKRMHQLSPRQSGGFFIVEVLLAIVILSAVFMTLFATLSFTANRTERSKFDSQAAGVMQEGVEVSRSALLSDWKAFVPGVYRPVFDVNQELWRLRPGGEGLLQARFTRVITISNVCRDKQTGEKVECISPTDTRIDANSKLIKVSVSWTEGKLEKNVEANLLLFFNS